MTNCMTFYDVLCQWNKETEIVIKCRKLSSQPLCATSGEALRPSTSYSCAHAIHCDSPGKLGKLSGVSPTSAWPIRGAHSAWACQAARSSVHESGPHSSELAVRFVKCRKLSWHLSQIVVTFFLCHPLPAVPFAFRRLLILVTSFSFMSCPILQTKTKPDLESQKITQQH